MCLYFALMYKTLGGYNWSDLFAALPQNNTEKCAATTGAPILATTIGDANFDASFDAGFDDQQFDTLDKSILASAKDLQLSFHGLKAVSVRSQRVQHSSQPFCEYVHIVIVVILQVFTTDVYRGLFGFATWWTCFVWFAASSLGMVYQSYFTKL